MARVRDAAKIYCIAFNAGLKPDPDLTISEWADLYRELPEGAKEKGRYRTSRVPYVREIQDCLSPSSPVEEVVAMKGTQLTLTTVGENFVFFSIHMAPDPILFVMPTMDLAKEHSKDRLAPSIEAMACLKGLVKDVKSRDSGNTILSKKFPGGFLKLTGANSAKSFRSKSIRYLVLDDVDGFDADVGGEGDPCALAKKRTDTYKSKKKIFENSTPTIKGLSRIERSYEASDKRKYQVPCPLCHEKQELVWGGRGADFGIKFIHEGKRVSEIWYECRFCHGKIEEYHKTWMLENGTWVPENPGARVRGYHLSSLYSPLGWVSWKQIAEEFLEAGNNQALLRVWTNTRLAQTWEEAGSQPRWEALKARADTYSVMTVPPGGLFLTRGVDTQDDRLEFEIWAWGRGEESWVIAWGVIVGDPSGDYVWNELDKLRSKVIPHAYGADLQICSTAIDAMGHKTQEVKNYCRTRMNSVMAIQGQHGEKIALGRPSLQDVTWHGKLIKNGVQLWPVGVNQIKGTIYDRLQIITPGSKMIHFPADLDDEFYIQLTSEKKITTYRKGIERKEWVKEPGKRNEGLDTAVYAYAAAVRAGLLRMDWDELERMIVPQEHEEARQITPAKSQRPRVAYKSKMMGD
jgi:phage terminase large subunit GpA-like protein